MSRAIVVVPCYNEANRLDARRFQEFAAASHSIRFLFVNDGSSDGTLGILERLHAVHPDRFRFLHLPRNCGKAEAVRQGILAALRERPQYVGFWDADLATPLEDIPKFCRVLDDKPKVQMVIGARLPLIGHQIERKPLRHVLGRLFANVAGILLGLGVYDTQCGAKMFRTGEITAELFADPFLVRWIFDVELFARLIATRRHLGGPAVDRQVYEFPLDSWRDVAGSKVKPSDFVRSLAELVVIYWTYLRPGMTSAAVTARLEAAGHPPRLVVLPRRPEIVADVEPTDRRKAA